MNINWQAVCNVQSIDHRIELANFGDERMPERERQSLSMGYPWCFTQALDEKNRAFDMLDEPIHFGGLLAYAYTLSTPEPFDVWHITKACYQLNVPRVHFSLVEGWPSSNPEHKNERQIEVYACLPIEWQAEHDLQAGQIFTFNDYDFIILYNNDGRELIAAPTARVKVE